MAASGYSAVMSTAEFSALLLLFAAATFTPGPNTTLATALAANRGLRGTLHFICAVAAGWIMLLLLCGAGLGALVLAAPWLRWGILVVGVLTCCGWPRAWRAAARWARPTRASCR
jgi:threonine/homoserine/homoserine lactone efflux protein